MKKCLAANVLKHTLRPGGAIGTKTPPLSKIKYIVHNFAKTLILLICPKNYELVKNVQ